MRIQVLVRLKPGVLDVQGKAVEGGLKNIGFSGVTGVRIGKLIEFDIEGESLEGVRPQVDEICRKLLVNPIIENFEIRAA